MEKACNQCGKTFEALRSDAQYCSEKCRAKANYEKKRKKDDFNAYPQAESGRNDSENIKVNIVGGELDFKELKATLSKNEKDLEIKNIQIMELEQENRQLQNEILLLNKKVLSIRNEELDKILKLMEMPDFYIYNNYLNEDYLEAKKSGNKFAKIALKSEDDLQRPGSNEIRLKIGNYRYKLSLKAGAVEKKIEAIEKEIVTNQDLMNTNTEKIRWLIADTKFYQSRILKYDSLLSV